VNSFGSGLDASAQRTNADTAGDAILVAEARCGDSCAFAELGKRHSRRVLHKIYRITNNWQDAEDVLQESLMRAFVHLHTFECKASFSTWFTSIAMNTALMLLRKQRDLRDSQLIVPLMTAQNVTGRNSEIIGTTLSNTLYESRGRNC
jgi:DNA-directed RNA polymerase specialized sigma24 family protein